jgi:hypothetical protein
MKCRIPADGPGTDADDLFHPEVVSKPVRGVITVIDEQRSALHIRIVITPYED